MTVSGGYKLKIAIRDRLAKAETEARKLAWSGEYRSSKMIETALLNLGFLEAPKIFANRWTHSELDRICDQTQRM